MAAPGMEERHVLVAGALPFPTKDRLIGLVAPPSSRCYAQTAPRRLSEATLFYGPASQKFGTSPPSKTSSESRTLLRQPISRLFSPLYSPPPSKAVRRPREYSNTLAGNWQNWRPTSSSAFFLDTRPPVQPLVNRLMRNILSRWRWPGASFVTLEWCDKLFTMKIAIDVLRRRSIRKSWIRS